MTDFISSRWPRWCLCLLVAATTLLVYLPSAILHSQSSILVSPFCVFVVQSGFLRPVRG
jgi:hypothetical protein